MVFVRALGLQVAARHYRDFGYGRVVRRRQADCGARPQDPEILVPALPGLNNEFFVISERIL